MHEGLGNLRPRNKQTGLKTVVTLLFGTGSAAPGPESIAILLYDILYTSFPGHVFKHIIVERYHDITVSHTLPNVNVSIRSSRFPVAAKPIIVAGGSC